MISRPDFKKIENKWQKIWLEKGIYKFSQDSAKPLYIIDTPPPTISGRLHLGHALNYSFLDMVARYKRLRGYNVLFPIGFDNNGQPTGRFVEEKRRINFSQVSKDTFNKIVEEDLREVEKSYKESLLALGTSFDWSLLYRTIDKKCIKAAQFSFLDLYQKGLVYRAEGVSLWCPECQTGLSQADVEYKKRNVTLNYIKFDTDEGELVVATTRPELLPACQALFIHTQDSRRKVFLGKKAKVPLFNFEVPILENSDVDTSFGTGIVMLCTFGDRTDVKWQKQYGLPVKICLTKDGKLKNAGKYEGLAIEEAKAAILFDLNEHNCLKKQEKFEQTVGVCWRCSTPIEYINSKQWFIKVLDFKKELEQQGKKVSWHPPHFLERYINWVENIKWDWVISRQRPFGVPIPVWYCKKCGKEKLPDLKELPVNPLKSKPKKCSCSSTKFKGEKDVFDTWMTSSLTPQIVLEWPEKRPNFAKLFSKSLRSQGYDIIRTWAFYTILKAFHHFGNIPWKEIAINGMVLDQKCRAMHKSLGNVIEPQDMIAKYSADVLRYWVTTKTLGENIPFQEKELKHGLVLCTKLWNAGRFAQPFLKTKPKNKSLEQIDRWILSRLTETIDDYCKFFDDFEVAKARQKIEMFFKHEFCDFYIEIIKHRLYAGRTKSFDAAVATLYTCLLSILKLFSPIMPHITEELYHILFRANEKESIHLSSFPKRLPIDKRALKIGKLACEVLSEIRKWKQQQRISFGSTIHFLEIGHPKAKELEEISNVLKKTMRIKNLEIKEDKEMYIKVKSSIS